MKKTDSIFYVILILILVSCKNSQKSEVVTENFKRNYFEQNISSHGRNLFRKYGINTETQFKKFYTKYYDTTGIVNWDDQDIYALEEEYIDTTKSLKDRNWIRFTVNPTFRKLYCIILEHKNDKSYLSVKTTDGTGGYTSGTLDFIVTKIISDSSFLHFQRKFQKLNFYSIPRNAFIGDCRDGDSWTLEAIDNGQYNLIYMSCPSLSQDSVIIELAKIGKDLKSLIHFDLINDSISRKPIVY